MIFKSFTLLTHIFYLFSFLFNDTEKVIAWKGMLYQSTEHEAELKLSRHLPICTLSTFSWLTEGEKFGKSEHSSSNRRAKKGL